MPGLRKESKRFFYLIRVFFHWKSLQISQQIFYTFALAAVGVIALFIINYFNTILLSTSHDQIEKYKDSHQNLMKFKDEIKNIETHSTYIRSNLEAGHALTLWEKAMVESFPQLLESASVGVTALIQEMAPEEYVQFNTDFDAAMNASREGSGIFKLNAISKTYFAILKLADTTQKVTLILQKRIEVRIKAN